MIHKNINETITVVDRELELCNVDYTKLLRLFGVTLYKYTYNKDMYDKSDNRRKTLGFGKGTEEHKY